MAACSVSRYVCVNNPYWQSSGIIFLYKYYIVISDTLMAFGCVFLVPRCNIIRASWETKNERLSYRKKYIVEFVSGTSLFWLRTLLLMLFLVVFFVYFTFTLKKIFFAPENGGGLTSSPPSAYSPVFFINFSFIVKKYKRLKKIISIYLSLFSHWVLHAYINKSSSTGIPGNKRI